MTRTLPRRDFLKACKKLSLNQTVQPDSLSRGWVEIGYQRVNTVLEPGQFSKRGGIMDIWAPAETLPDRLDFFGDEIETIRKFDPASQRTVERLEDILVTPAREFLVGDSGIGNRESEDGLNPELRFPEVEPSEFLIPVLHSASASLLDYLLPGRLC